MFRSATAEFDKQLEKATSHLLLEPDWQSIIQICDIICQGDCQGKYAIAAIKKKFYHPNPHVSLYALHVLESVVKNCGSPIHDEIATKSFMEEMRELVRKCGNDNMRTKILELLQTWGFAFRNSPKYRIVQDTVNIMKAEGYSFPAIRESDAMFAADRAPEWADADNCHRCRTLFGVINRKHHCRACGQVFCGKCAGRFTTLPKFGIEKEVRACEDCYNKYSPDVRPVRGEEVEVTPTVKQSVSASSSPKANPKGKSEEELKLQEEEDLQLALALSRSEAEVKEKEKLKNKVSTLNFTSPVKQESSVKATPAENVDPELARYLNRSYWEQKQQQEREREREPRAAEPSSPAAQTASGTSPVANTIQKMTEKFQNGESEELDEFTSTLRGQVEMFVNRMKSNSSRGRSIANDSSVQTLFLNISTMHSKLLQYIQQQEDERVYYESLQDKLAQVRDARAALDALREEHRERLRREAEEAERQRQIQMAHKLEIMRKKKQEYLQYQRQLTLQRMQEEQREMQMRMEQQKHMYLMGLGYLSFFLNFYFNVPPPMAMMPGMPPPSQLGGYPPFMPHPGMLPPYGPDGLPLQYPYPAQGPVNQPPHPMPGAPGHHQMHGTNPNQPQINVPGHPQGPMGQAQGPMNVPGHSQGPMGHTPGPMNVPGHPQGPIGQASGHSQGPIGQAPGHSQGPIGQASGPMNVPGQFRAPHPQGPFPYQQMGYSATAPAGTPGSEHYPPQHPGHFQQQQPQPQPQREQQPAPAVAELISFD
nr:EOG090X05AE [Eulimnadia texana]